MSVGINGIGVTDGGGVLVALGWGVAVGVSVLLGVALGWLVKVAVGVCVSVGGLDGVRDG